MIEDPGLLAPAQSGLATGPACGPENIIDCGRFRSIQDAFAAQVAKGPDAVAVDFGSETLSYRDLDRRSTQLARYLQRRGIGRESVVAVRMEGIEFVVAILGILKAGAAYLPLERSIPEQRLNGILKDANPGMVLWQKTPGDPELARQGSPAFDSLLRAIGRESDAPLRLESSPEDLAYIMYTSGSTGQPKGVEIPHAGVTGLVLDTNYISFRPDDRVAQVSNVAFDAATFEIWGALLNGACLVVLDKHTLLSPGELRRELHGRGITTLFLTTSVFHQMASEMPGAFRGLRALLVGGEACDPRAVRSVLRHGPPRRLLNGYGPTECTTFALFHEVRQLDESAGSVPIGKPISATEVLLLDDQLRPTPRGEIGEIYLGGPRLARGYLHRAELTRKHFIPHPFTRGARLYRTGDLARESPDGNLEFIGRADRQVKFNGFRIELGEIEAALGVHPKVDQRAVLLLGQTGEERRLAAYLTAKGNERADSAELRAFLKERLPHYMIPAAFVWMDRLPLGANGKLDTDALKALDTACAHEEGRYSPPETPTERALADIWKEILHVPRVGRDDNFFDLGGRSLTAAAVFARIAQTFGKSIPHGIVIRESTLRELAAIIDGEDAISPVVEIKSAALGLPLFLAPGGAGSVFDFRALAQHAELNRTIYGLEAPWLSCPRERYWVMEELAAYHLEEIRKIQPHGPYHIGGYSLGGSIAFEIAQQFRRHGEEVASLLLVEAFNPYGARRLSCRERIATNLRNVEGLSWARKIDSIARRARGMINGMLAVRLVRAPLGANPWIGRLNPADMVTTQIELLRRYRPQAYPGPITLILGEQLGDGFGFEYDLNYGWQDVATGGLRCLRTPGNHYTLFDEPHVRTLARQIALSLAGKP